jgi:hypothetical protein
MSVPHFAARCWPFSDVVAARTGNSVTAVRDRLVRDVSGRHAKRGRCDLQDPAAKRLLDDTVLRLSDIAFAAGFGSKALQRRVSFDLWPPAIVVSTQRAQRQSAYAPISSATSVRKSPGLCRGSSWLEICIPSNQ